MARATAPDFREASFGEPLATQHEIDRLRAVKDREQTQAYHVMSFTELENLPDPEFLIDGWLVEGLNLTVGAPGTGKSFLSLSQALAVSTGSPWMNRDVKAGAVVYVAAEGARGIRARIDAWLEAHDLTDPGDFGILGEAPPLDDPDALAAVIEGIARFAPEPALVVIDTLARTFGEGNENDAGDMGSYVANLSTLSRRFGGTAIDLVHHTGWDEKHERGSNALRGAADCVRLVSKKGSTVTVRNAKQKDAPEAEALTLEAVEIGRSLVLELSSNPGDDNLRRLNPNEGELLRFLSSEIDDNGCSRRSLLDEMGWSESTHDRAMKTLTDRGFAVKQGTTRDAVFLATEEGRAHCRH